MNTYMKYTTNVFLAKCTEKHEKGETIIVTTKHGKENECVVFNQIYAAGDYFYYSIVRADGFNAQEWAKKRRERLEAAALRAEQKSSNYYSASKKDSDFLSLGEPIKVGHHSERRHRRIIEQSQNNMRKCIEFSDKAENLEEKTKYWEAKEAAINLSMPESIEYYEYKLEEARIRHEGLKNGTIERDHSFSLVYAKKEVNELTKKHELAKQLWG